MEFYTYLWLREDGTPYYGGKGHGRRGFTSSQHTVKCPREVSRILIQSQASEQDALEAEQFLIEYYGRADLATGCLRNLTAGGDGVSGLIHSEKTKQRMREVHLNPSAETRQKIREANLGKVHRKEDYAPHRERWLGSRNPNFGRDMSGSKNPRFGKGKISNPEVLAIHEMWQGGQTQKVIALRFGVDPSHISRILSGEKRLLRPAQLAISL